MRGKPFDRADPIQIERAIETSFLFQFKGKLIGKLHALNW
jgi:hypothetical protein